MIVVYRYRVKSLSGLLDRQSRAVNFVWNHCNDRQKDALRFHLPWHTGFDLNQLTAGSGAELGLHSATINAVCEQCAKSRSRMRKSMKVLPPKPARIAATCPSRDRWRGRKVSSQGLE